jgi:hypothetical protein
VAIATLVTTLEPRTWMARTAQLTSAVPCVGAAACPRAVYAARRCAATGRAMSCAAYLSKSCALEDAKSCALLGDLYLVSAA